MESNINDESISQKQDKPTTSLRDLMDDQIIEGLNYSEIYEEYGDIKDQMKQIYDLEGKSAGRYTNKYLHYIMKNEDLKKTKKNKD